VKATNLRSGSSRNVVLMDKTTRHIVPSNRRAIGPTRKRIGSRLLHLRVKTSMGPGLVVVGGVGPEQSLEVAAAEHEHPVQALGPDRTDPPLGEAPPRIGLGHADRCAESGGQDVRPWSCRATRPSWRAHPRVIPGSGMISGFCARSRRQVKSRRDAVVQHPDGILYVDHARYRCNCGTVLAPGPTPERPLALGTPVLGAVWLIFAAISYWFAGIKPIADFVGRGSGESGLDYLIGLVSRS
jgi:hypothetical protein